jgi:hypothetical protein
MVSPMASIGGCIGLYAPPHIHEEYRISENTAITSDKPAVRIAAVVVRTGPGAFTGKLSSATV